MIRVSNIKKQLTDNFQPTIKFEVSISVEHISDLAAMHGNKSVADAIGVAVYESLREEGYFPDMKKDGPVS